MKLRNPSASFAQFTHGGWPVAAAVDGDPATGWSIDPAEGRPRAAVFETELAIDFPARATLPVRPPAGLRARATTSVGCVCRQPPQSSPSRPQDAHAAVVVNGEVPASAEGGLLVVSVRLNRGSQPAGLRGPGSAVTAAERSPGSPEFTPVVGTDTYPCCWQSWRLPVTASVVPSRSN